jgi:predicted esterase
VKQTTQYQKIYLESAKNQRGALKNAAADTQILTYSIDADGTPSYNLPEAPSTSPEAALFAFSGTKQKAVVQGGVYRPITHTLLRPYKQHHIVFVVWHPKDSLAQAMFLTNSTLRGHANIALLYPEYGAYAQRDRTLLTDAHIRKDAQAVHNFLIAQGYDPANIIPVGFSLGCVFAATQAQIAQEAGTLYPNLMLHAPFSSKRDVTKIGLGIADDAMSVVDKVTTLTNTALTVYSNKSDWVTPPQHQKAICAAYQKATGKNAILIKVPGGHLAGAADINPLTQPDIADKHNTLFEAIKQERLASNKTSQYSTHKPIDARPLVSKEATSDKAQTRPKPQSRDITFHINLGNLPQSTMESAKTSRTTRSSKTRHKPDGSQTARTDAYRHTELAVPMLLDTPSPQGNTIDVISLAPTTENPGLSAKASTPARTPRSRDLQKSPRRREKELTSSRRAPQNGDTVSTPELQDATQSPRTQRAKITSSRRRAPKALVLPLPSQLTQPFAPIAPIAPLPVPTPILASAPKPELKKRHSAPTLGTQSRDKS